MVEACDKALDAKDRQIEVRDLRIQQSKDVMDLQAKQLADKDSWYNKPWVWLSVGAVIGGYVAGRR